MPLDTSELPAMPRRQLDTIMGLRVTSGFSWETIIDDIRRAVVAANNDKAWDDRAAWDDEIHKIADRLVPPDASAKVSEHSQVGAAWDVNLDAFDAHYARKTRTWTSGIGNLSDRTSHVLCGRALYMAYADAVRRLVESLERTV